MSDFLLDNSGVRMSVITLFYWDHPWSAVAETARVFSNALTSLSVEVKPVNIMDVNLNVKQAVLTECLAQPEIMECDIAISLGAPPLSIRVGEQWLFEVLGKSFYLLSMDALFYDYNRVNGVAEFLHQARSSGRLGVIAGDRDACRILDKLIAGTPCHMAPGGFFLPLTAADRLERVAVIASMGWELADVPENISFEQLVIDKPPILGECENLAAFAEAIEEPGPIRSIPNLAMEILGVPPELIYTHELCWYFCRLDAFQKRRRRKAAVEGLSQIPIDFYGPNWEPFTAGFRDCRYMGSIPTQQMPVLAQRYSVLLDFNPGFGHSLHDRVYTGVGNGCRVMTNTCTAISDLKLPDEDAVIPYDVKDPNLADVANRALALPPLKAEPLLSFRAENSPLARMDEFLLFANSGDSK